MDIRYDRTQPIGVRTLISIGDVPTATPLSMIQMVAGIGLIAHAATRKGKWRIAEGLAGVWMVAYRYVAALLPNE